MRAAALLVAAALFGCGAPSPPTTPEPALAGDDGSVVYTNATVITGDVAHPEAWGLRVADGRITHLFDGEPPADLPGRRVDLQGAVVLPGLTDAHMHLRGLGRSARQLDLKGTTSEQAVIDRVAEAVRTTPPGAWIRGRGWDQNDWAVQAFPTVASLDAAAPDHPVWLTRIDGHAVWLNSAALALAGIDASTADPPGGELIRDAAGAPTGVLVDAAIGVAAEALPSATRDEVRTDVLRGIEACQKVGLTSVHTMGVGVTELGVLRELAEADQLGLNVVVYLSGGSDGIDAVIEQGPSEAGRLSVVGVKLFADGALGSRGAALLAPYSDRPDTSGLLIYEPEQLTTRARQIHDAGFQLAIHAIGDRGNRVTIDAIAAAQGDERDRGHRIEHAQIVDPDDIPRLAELGIVASMQPTHATSDMPWAPDRLGPERLAGAYAWRRMIEAEAVLAFGSDAPVEEIDPWFGLYAAVSRQDAEGQPDGGWLPDQRLTFDEALIAFTRTPAEVAGQDRGVLRVGAPADLTVVDRDPRSLAAAGLLQVRTLRTIVGGEQVFAP